MRMVFIESPYAGNYERNVQYALHCLKDSIDRGEAPFVPHLLYTQVLQDEIPDERALALTIAANWRRSATLIAVYTNLGITAGMQLGIDDAKRLGINVELRELGREVMAELEGAEDAPDADEAWQEIAGPAAAEPADGIDPHAEEGPEYTEKPF